MKLAEALQERADLKREISQLEERLSNNAVKQEGQDSAEDPLELIRKLEDTLCRLKDLTTAINLKNSQVLCEGKSMTEMLAERDVMEKRLRILRQFANDASEITPRGLKTEIVMLSTIDVRTLRKKLDMDAKELRLLDNKIQSINWTTEL